MKQNTKTKEIKKYLDLVDANNIAGRTNRYLEIIKPDKENIIRGASKYIDLVQPWKILNNNN